MNIHLLSGAGMKFQNPEMDEHNNCGVTGLCPSTVNRMWPVTRSKMSKNSSLHILNHMLVP